MSELIDDLILDLLEEALEIAASGSEHAHLVQLTMLARRRGLDCCEEYGCREHTLSPSPWCQKHHAQMGYVAPNLSLSNCNSGTTKGTWEPVGQWKCWVCPVGGIGLRADLTRHLRQAHDVGGDS